MKKKEILKDVNSFSLNLKKNILEMALVAGANSSHFGGALSIVDIVSILFCSQIRSEEKNKKKINKDRFILSKGHACLAYYAALCEIGIIKKEELKTFEKNDSNLLGHPVLNKNIGIDFSTGSLGMGLSIGIGVAIANQKRENNFNTYVLLGDGECNEGSVWEAAMAAPNFKLNNLYAIIDHNKFQQTGSNKEIMDSGSLKKKWDSFGWDTTEIDGHNTNDLLEYFESRKNILKPKALIANTIKGKGFTFSENNNDWHHSVLTKSLYEQALSELK